MRDGGQTDSPEGGAFRGLKVLVAEDEAVIAMDLAMTLRGFGCEVLRPAVSVVQAFQLLEAGQPDVALLDLSLCDGLATPIAEALAVAGVPFAFITGWDAHRLEALAHSDTPLPRKPFNQDALCEVLAKLCVHLRAYRLKMI